MIIAFFVILIIAVVVFYIKKNSVSVRVNLPGPATYAFDIVGEASYQKALSKICGGKKEDSAKQYVEAELYLENDNPHDNKAVCVTIKGQTVGYLSRNDARAFRKQVKELENKKPTFLCKALIVGGWSRSKSDKGNFGVKLDLPVA